MTENVSTIWGASALRAPTIISSVTNKRVTSITLLNINAENMMFHNKARVLTIQILEVNNTELQLKMTLYENIEDCVIFNIFNMFD